MSEIEAKPVDSEPATEPSPIKKDDDQAKEAKPETEEEASEDAPKTDPIPMLDHNGQPLSKNAMKKLKKRQGWYANSYLL